MARVFIISNRVALPNAGVQPGGLEVALKATLRKHSCVWLGWSGEVNETPRTRRIERGDNSYVVTDLSPGDFDEYYNGFANRVLWPILHYRLDLAEFTRRDLTGYLRVNAHFADQLAGMLGPRDIVWVHDYHLFPLAGALRARGFTNPIGFFLHIPLPAPEILAAMPNHETLISALQHYDLVGFQTDDDAANFARYLAKESGATAHIARPIPGGERAMRIGVFPVGIETRRFARLAERAVRTKFVQQVMSSIPGALMIGVDRMDYSKGIPQRLESYERFLAANPQWHGKVTYLQITPKSRSQIKEYAEMEQAVNAAAGRINGAYSEAAWTPVRYVNRPYSRTALAGLYRAARVGLVTPMRDGMNLHLAVAELARAPFVFASACLPPMSSRNPRQCVITSATASAGRTRRSGTRQSSARFRLRLPTSDIFSQSPEVWPLPLRRTNLFHPRSALREIGR